MEKRVGSVLIVVTEKENVSKLNTVLSQHGDIIVGRMGLNLGLPGAQVISLVVHGTTDRISSLTGKVGKLKGFEVKSVLSKYAEEDGVENEVAEH
ncbi:CopG family transcriptional regulator [bacterium]|nr:CopG family transcriptional regulator [bacterium]MBP5202023.1 CopG family transcriptional regulator [bacterium]